MARAAIQDEDRAELAEFIAARWQGEFIVSYGEIFHPHREEGFLERREGKIVGALTFTLRGGSMHILTLNSAVEGTGIGSSLMLQTLHVARERGLRRIWLTTSSNNLKAIGFYQRLGFRMTELRLGALDDARKTKPNIPLTGDRGVANRDEVVMELHLEPYLDPSI